MEISFYDSTGKVTGSAQINDHMAEEVCAAEGTHPHVVGNYFGQPVYVLAGVVTDRPTNPVVLTGLELTLLPVPCTILINAASYPCTEDHATLSFNLPGTYKITVKSWPYLDKEFTYAN